MSSNNLQLKLKKAGLLFSLLLGFVLLSPTDADAQNRKAQEKYEKQREKLDRKREKLEDKMERQRERIEDRRERWEDRNDDDDYRDRRNSGYYGNNGSGYGSNTNYEVARRNGYEDGLRAGAEDARDGDRYNPQGHSDFRRATDGYNSRYGNRGQYQQAYRDAFVQGYNEAYRNNDRRNRNGRWGF